MVPYVIMCFHELPVSHYDDLIKENNSKEVVMNLNQVLSTVNQVEKAKFISCLDRLCSEVAQTDKSIAKRIENIDGQIKHASGNDISALYEAVKDHFRESIKEQILMSSAQINLLVNILSRDGNCVARLTWIETLYVNEWESITELTNTLRNEMDTVVENVFNRAKSLNIYHKCIKEAYENDSRNNREKKITDDERGILNILSHELNLTVDECAAMEHMVNPIGKDGIQDALNQLRDIGLLFISKKRQEVFIPDELVELLNSILGKDLADKYKLRILRSLSDAELNNILKAHNRKMRGISRIDKIKSVIHAGIDATELLMHDIHNPSANMNDKKERLKQLITDLNIDVEKIGTTINERCDIIINFFKNASESEFNVLSASGYKELLTTLEMHYEEIIKIIKEQFELEPNETINTDKLKMLGITPYDILYILSNDEVKTVRDSMNLSKRGDPRLVILESFANATDRLIENYDLLAHRDLNGLKESGIDILEADIGVKFEEVTKAIFEELGLIIDEDIRKEINTAKDKADIVIALSNDDIVIGEAKTSKKGDFAKYSSTSRQVKAYVNRAENIGKRVAQVLIIAPSFSDNFIESAEMDTEVNISLLEASGLKMILDAFTFRRNPKFSPKLFTKGGLLKAELIAKNL